MKKMPIFAAISVSYLTLLGCGSAKTSQMVLPGGTTFGYSDSQFAKIGDQLDRPDEIFKRAGYPPLWTATKELAAGRLPKGLNVVPREARVWEPWFRKQLTHQGKQLSTGDLLKMKWVIVQTVAKDTACQRSAGQSEAVIIKGVEAARIKALKSLGMDDSNPVIFQMSRLDAAFARPKSQHGYDYNPTPALADIEDRQKRYPTLGELNAADSLSCARGGLEMIRILRGMEKIKPSGLKAGAVFVFKFSNQDINKGGASHSMVCAEIILPGNQKARLYYDPTPSKSSFAQMDLSLISKYAGPLDMASFESLANVACISKLEEQSDAWEKDGVDHIVYNYVLGENWPQFAIGNYDYSSTLGGIGGYLSMKKGVAAFSEYRKQNFAKLGSLENALTEVHLRRN